LATNLVVADSAEVSLLDIMKAAFNSSFALTMHLYQNSFSPYDAMTIGMFTESTFGGYSALAITGWATPTFVSPRAVMNASALLWTATGSGLPQNVYGYYVTDGAGNLIFAQYDPNAPVVLVNPGDPYAVIPAFSCRSEY
jgi:hypothetical protein